MLRASGAAYKDSPVATFQAAERHRGTLVGTDQFRDSPEGHAGPSRPARSVLRHTADFHQSAPLPQFFGFFSENPLVAKFRRQVVPIRTDIPIVPSLATRFAGR